MFNPKISVIIPVYNVESYLEYCLDSLLNQTIIDDIEVIMIDDGSTDNSRHIIENYALDYDNFFAFHQKNKGQGIARNFGLRKARGEYIHFLDADDYLAFDAYEKLLNFAIKNDNDFVLCKVAKFTENTIWNDVIFRNLFKNISSDIAKTNIFKLNDLVWDTIAANKLYKKEFLFKNKIRFLDKKILYEDMLFSFQAHCLADNVGIINEDLYFWRFRHDMTSSTQSLKNKAVSDRFSILRLIQQYMVNNNFEKELIINQYLKWLRHDFLIYLRRINQISSNYHRKLLDNIRFFLYIIPGNLTKKLNGYSQILYHYVENYDLNKLLNISHLDDSLVEDMCHNDLYVENHYNVDFFNSIDYEELVGELVNITAVDEFLIIDLKTFIQFVPKTDNDVLAFKLTGENFEYELNYEVEENIYKLFVPFKFIGSKYLKIKIDYSIGNITKTSILKTSNRYVIKYVGFEFNLSKVQNRELILFSRKLGENKIELNSVEFDDDFLILAARSDEKINEIVAEHLIDLTQYVYDVDYSDGNNFYLKLSLNHLTSKHVNKWQLKLKSNFNYIKANNLSLVAGNFYIKFHNQRNGVVINIKKYDVNDLIRLLENNIHELKENIYYLKEHNNNLIESNKDFKIILDEFKNRKLVRFLDKFRFG